MLVGIVSFDEIIHDLSDCRFQIGTADHLVEPGLPSPLTGQPQASTSRDRWHDAPPINQPHAKKPANAGFSHGHR
jgi:hypothetical protein